MFYSPVITNAAEVAQGDKLHLFKYIEDPEQYQLKTYQAHGGYKVWKDTLGTVPTAEVISIVKDSGLRGRGGAGFPTGLKWSFVPKDSPKPRYLVCNADESEPGTCKDRVLMERDPHAVIEGMALAAYAIGCHLMFIYIRGEFGYSIRRLEAALAEANANGHLGKNIYGTGYDLEMIVHTGGGAYICGEESALLNSLEGLRGMTRMRPPFPAVEGLYACPTIVNNVESLVAVTHILRNGADWYKSMGTEKSAGSKLFSLSGHIKRPGNYEVELGFNLKKFIYDPAYGNGLLGDSPLKAVIPGGSSTPMMTPDQIDCGLDYESLVEQGSMLGSGAVIVFNEDTCIVWVVKRLIHFYRHESCGKCTPCREGTGWLELMINRIEAGQGQPGDVEKIEDICGNIMYSQGHTICPLGEAAVMPIISSIKHWRDEWQYHIDNKRCLVETNFDIR